MAQLLILMKFVILKHTQGYFSCERSFKPSEECVLKQLPRLVLTDMCVVLFPEVVNKMELFLLEVAL